MLLFALVMGIAQTKFAERADRRPALYPVDQLGQVLLGDYWCRSRSSACCCWS